MWGEFIDDKIGGFMMKRIGLGILFLSVLTGCRSDKAADRPNGWYFITDNVTDSVSEMPIVTVEDFAELRLDSSVMQSGESIYQIIGKLKAEKAGDFADATERVTGHRIGCVYAGEIFSDPQVNMGIASGTLAISSFTLSLDREKMEEIYRNLLKEMSGGE